MTYETIVPVRFLFKREPDDVEIIGVYNLFLTHEEYDTLTDEVALTLLQEHGFNVIKFFRSSFANLK